MQPTVSFERDGVFGFLETARFAHWTHDDRQISRESVVLQTHHINRWIASCLNMN